ncbi:MAG: DUF6788 family protein [Dermatophilaceae bacterium]
MPPSLSDLEQQRAQLYAELVDVGDFRRGSITENYRRCGKGNCACATPEHPGHGPRQLWTRSVPGGRTKGRQLAVGPEVNKVRRELARYKEFVTVSQQIVEVNEAICEARPISAFADDGLSPTQPAGERGALLPAPGAVRRRGSPAGRTGGRLARH